MYEIENRKLFDFKVVDQEALIGPRDTLSLVDLYLVCLSSILSPGEKGAAYHLDIMFL